MIRLNFLKGTTVAKTLSTMQELGMTAPEFRLPDTEGNLVAFTDIAGPKGTLVMFICNHCPYVIHIRNCLRELTSEYLKKGIGVVAINSNDADGYPADSFEKMQDERRVQNYPFSYLYDEPQTAAKAYGAACTPDFFLFDRQKKLVYRGQLDSSRPGNSQPNDGRDLRKAMDALIGGQAIDKNQMPSMGCNIKWKPGNEPTYYT
jgi:peroxiredoxin